MTDTVIKGTGNSRLIKAPPNLAALAPEYSNLVALLIEGLPADISGPVAAGCDVVGTLLGKTSLLSDSTEKAIWGDAANRYVDDAIAKLNYDFMSGLSNVQNKLDKKTEIIVGQYSGTATVVTSGTSTSSRTIHFGASPKAVLVIPNTGNVHSSGNTATTYGGLALQESPVVEFGGVGGATKYPAVEITDDGFKVYQSTVSSSIIVQCNRSGIVYHYIAFI